MMQKGKINLLIQSLSSMLIGAAMLMLLLFLPAGTFYYRGAWLLVALLFIPMVIIGAVLLVCAPEMLRRRLDVREDRETQKGVVKLSGLLFVVGFLIASFDFRYGWSAVNEKIFYVAVGVFLLGYAMYAETVRENHWLSRSVKVHPGQSIVTTGLYRIVRHPMYSATLFMFLSMPLILGSYYAFAVFLLYIPIIVHRILDEEKLLHRELTGYDEYCCRTRWRLLPFVW